MMTGSGLHMLASPEQAFRYSLILLAASASGVLLAFHPVERGRSASIDDLEQRKTVILYAAIGALIAIICQAIPAMAFVIFGIGGLMRFRTDVGASKRTGHTIMATLIGLCWGLHLWLLAGLGTIFFWLMIYALDAASVRELLVGGVAIPDMPRSAEAYRAAITRSGAQLLSHNKLFGKSSMSFVLRLPKAVPMERVQQELDAIPEALRGTPDWPA